MPEREAKEPAAERPPPKATSQRQTEELTHPCNSSACRFVLPAGSLRAWAKNHRINGIAPAPRRFAVLGGKYDFYIALWRKIIFTNHVPPDGAAPAGQPH